jgi:IclR family transcriptional regulator, KDG regulon repressor
MTSKPKYPIDTVIKASLLIEALGESKQELSLKTLREKVNFSASSTHRLLDTLVSIGYVQRNPETHRYKLGLGLFQIGVRVLSQYGMNPDVRSVLEQLVEDTGETAKLGARYNGRMVYLGLVESTNPLRFTGHIGSWSPLHCTAMGKLLLSSLPRSEQETILSGLLPLKQYTPNTIVDKDQLIDLLVSIRQSSYALDDEEFLVGSRGLACPVLNDQGKIVAAVSISGPSARLSKEILLGYLPPLRKAAVKLSQVTVL